jgi:hypothetical protein
LWFRTLLENQPQAELGLPRIAQAALHRAIEIEQQAGGFGVLGIGVVGQVEDVVFGSPWSTGLGADKTNGIPPPSRIKVLLLLPGDQTMPRRGWNCFFENGMVPLEGKPGLPINGAKKTWLGGVMGSGSICASQRNP